MLNAVKITRFIVSICSLYVGAATSICYAVHTTETVEVSCNQPSNGKWTRYEGKPGVIQSLVVPNVRISAESDKLVPIWDLDAKKYGDLQIVALCFSPTTKEKYNHIDLSAVLHKEDQVIARSITCKRGDGIALKALSTADLTLITKLTETDEDEINPPIYTRNTVKHDGLTTSNTSNSSNQGTGQLEERLANLNIKQQESTAELAKALMITFKEINKDFFKEYGKNVFRQDITVSELEIRIQECLDDKVNPIKDKKDLVRRIWRGQ